jgi:hypothetical protein
MPLFRLGSVYRNRKLQLPIKMHIFCLSTVITGTVELRNAGQPLLPWVTGLSHYTTKENITSNQLQKKRFGPMFFLFIFKSTLP